MLVTHHIEEGLSLATHAAIMYQGRLIRTGDRASIVASAYADEYRDLVVAGE